MARAQKEPLRPLTPGEYQALEGVSKASSERMDTVRRARALQAVAQGHTFAQAAWEVGFGSVTTVANLVGRFNQRGLGTLRIAAGRGRRVTYGTEERARIVAVAQQEPQRRADQTATWSLATLQRRLRRDGLPRVGATTIRRVLHDAGSSYQRTRTWCPTGTAVRKRKEGVMRVIDPQTEEKNYSGKLLRRWHADC